MPPPIRSLLVRCLEKDPRRRLQAIGEARIALDDIISDKNPDAAAFGAAADTNGAVPCSVWPVAVPWIAVAGLTATVVADGSIQPITKGSFGRIYNGEQFVYCRDGRLMVAPFDPVTRKLTGPARAVLEGMMQHTLTVSSMFALSDGGTPPGLQPAH